MNSIPARATLVVDHDRGRVLTGSFDRCMHEGTAWEFERYVISFYTNAQILCWFEEVAKRKKEGYDISCWECVHRLVLYGMIPYPGTVRLALKKVES